MTVQPETIQLATEARKAAEKVVEGMPESARKDRAFEIAFAAFLASSGGAVAAPKQKSSRTARSNAASAQSTGRSSRQPKGVRAILVELVDEGFFDSPKSLPDIVGALRAAGRNYKQEELSKPMQRLTLAKIVRREQRAREGSGKKVWFYEKHPGR